MQRALLLSILVLLPALSPAQQTDNISDMPFALAGNSTRPESHPMHMSDAAGNGTMYIQDNGLREDRYNSPTRPPSRNEFIDAGNGTVEARFAPPFDRFFYYCSTEYGRKKSEDAHFREMATTTSARPQHPGHAGETSMACGCAYAQGSYTYPYCMAHLLSDIKLASDNTTRTSNSGQYFSFDGRIVYGADTMYGIVTIINKRVSIEHIHIKNKRTSSYTLADARLKAITLYKGPKELHLERLSPQDKHLSRLVHAGTLTVYDHSYSFLTADNVGHHLIMTTAGGYGDIKNSDELVAAMNREYGLRLHAGQSSHRDLTILLNRLN